MNRSAEKVFFIYELNRLHQECMVKTQHLANVTSGNVAITSDLIDKCADVFVQLKRLSDIFMRIANDIPCHEDELERIEGMKIKIKQYEAAAYEHWNDIRNRDIRNKHSGLQKPKKASVHKIGLARRCPAYSRNRDYQ